MLPFAAGLPPSQLDIKLYNRPTNLQIYRLVFSAPTQLDVGRQYPVPGIWCHFSGTHRRHHPPALDCTVQLLPAVTGQLRPEIVSGFIEAHRLATSDFVWGPGCSLCLSCMCFLSPARYALFDVYMNLGLVSDTGLGRRFRTAFLTSSDKSSELKTGARAGHPEFHPPTPNLPSSDMTRSLARLLHFRASDAPHACHFQTKRRVKRRAVVIAHIVLMHTFSAQWSSFWGACDPFGP